MSGQSDVPALLAKYARSIDHIAIAVNDLEQSIGFYIAR